MPDYMVKGDQTYRILSDCQGSVRMVVNTSTGAVAQQLQWDTWGNLISDTNPGFQPFGWAGGQYDSTVGLHHFGAREYDPQVGRFITKDPVFLAGGQNVYLYALGDPVNNVDPSGLDAPPTIHVCTGNTSGGFIWSVEDSANAGLPEMVEDLEELYPDAKIQVTRNIDRKTFLCYVEQKETIGIVYFGHGYAGFLDFNGPEGGLYASDVEGDLDFFIALACSAGAPDYNGATFADQLNAEYVYAFRWKVFHSVMRWKVDNATCGLRESLEEGGTDENTK